MPGHRQLDLFAPSEPASPPGEVVALARELPTGIRLGTSSWAFPGWRGLVYGDEVRAAELPKRGLESYARHPLFTTVGLDRSYYAPVQAPELARLASQVPESFRFVVKAQDACTLARFPKHRRYGHRAGTENPTFLDPAYATDAVVGPVLEGLGVRAGVVVFQFAPEPLEAFGGPSAFAERLASFLGALPAGVAYAVELRNPRLLTPAYFEALGDGGASHCFNHHPSMPPLDEQAHRFALERGRVLLVRWMLAHGRSYGDARADFEPFDRLREPDPAARRAVAALCLEARERQRPVYVVVNNKAEGSAPLSILELARELAHAYRERDDLPY